MRLVLCEGAENHPDGTYSIRRAGLDRWTQEVPFDIGVVLFIETEAGEVPTGAPLAINLELSGVVQSTAVAALVPLGPADVVRTSLHLQTRIETYGTLTVRADIEGVTAQVTARFHEPAAPTSS